MHTHIHTHATPPPAQQISKEDFQDVVGLLPENTPLPASEKMTYLLARLEVRDPLVAGTLAQQRVVRALCTMTLGARPCLRLWQ